MSVAVAILRLRLSTIPRIPRPRPPLSRSAGEGLGVRVARTAGEGLGVRAARAAGEEGGDDAPAPFPSSLPLRHGERKRGDSRRRGNPAPASVNDTEAMTTPRPQRGRGAGGEGSPLGSENVRRMAE